eukprot:scaffold13060_cov119-Isochrysis_galbana.AAC.3
MTPGSSRCVFRASAELNWASPSLVLFGGTSHSSLHAPLPVPVLEKKNKTPRARGGQRWRPDSSCWSWRRSKWPRTRARSEFALTTQTKAQLRWCHQATTHFYPLPRSSRATLRLTEQFLSSSLKDRHATCPRAARRRPMTTPYNTTCKMPACAQSPSIPPRVKRLAKCQQKASRSRSDASTKLNISFSYSPK